MPWASNQPSFVDPSLWDVRQQQSAQLLVDQIQRVHPAARTGNHDRALGRCRDQHRQLLGQRRIDAAADGSPGDQVVRPIEDGRGAFDQWTLCRLVGGIAGLAGVLFAYNQGAVDGSGYGIVPSIQIFLVTVIGGISTGVTLALAPVAEDLGPPWLSWDGTTQKGVEETMPKPRYAFRSVDNEAEAVMASILTARHFKGKLKTVAGINNDYSYGRDNWAAFLAIMKKFNMNVTPVAELWPKLGETSFTSHVATLQQAKPDLIFCSFWSGDAPILLKQGARGRPHRGHQARDDHGGGCPRAAQEGVLAGRHDPWLQLALLRGSKRERAVQGVHALASGEVQGVAELRVGPRVLHRGRLQGGRGEGGEGGRRHVAGQAEAGQEQGGDSRHNYLGYPAAPPERH